jgi:hypothetical protein
MWGVGSEASIQATVERSSERGRKEDPMIQLSVYLLLLGILLYLEEWSSESPNFVRVAVFGGAVIESALAMAFGA